jgi:hypothetical protein
MSAWLQQQALGGATAPPLRRRRARPAPAQAGCHPVPDAASPPAASPDPGIVVAPDAREVLDRLVVHVDRLCRDLQRVGVLVLVVALLLGLSHAWPALRWLLLE